MSFYNIVVDIIHEREDIAYCAALTLKSSDAFFKVSVESDKIHMLHKKLLKWMKNYQEGRQMRASIKGKCFFMNVCVAWSTVRSPTLQEFGQHFEQQPRRSLSTNH